MLCPICEKEHDSIKKLLSHLKRCKDEGHQRLYSLIKDIENITHENVITIFEENKENIPLKKKEKFSSIDYVKLFYDKRGTMCKNYAKDCSIIKSYYKKGITPEQIIIVLKYMVFKRYENLNLFGYCINDALLLNKCKQELDVENTPAYLVNLYYKEMGEKVNIQTLLNDVKKVEQTLLNFPYERIKYTLIYMAKKRININFIAHKIVEAKNFYEENKNNKTINKLKLVDFYHKIKQDDINNTCFIEDVGYMISPELFKDYLNKLQTKSISINEIDFKYQCVLLTLKQYKQKGVV